MTLNKETRITKDAANKKLHITREFGGSVEKVWKAWTQPELLDQWWAPRPWKAKTKSMDFRPGGFWLYCMQGPEGEAHWARADYKTITEHKNFNYIDAFCDENGVKTDFPGMDWTVRFLSIEVGTKVEIEILFTSEQAIEQIIEMGFQEGFTAAHGNLDELLEK